ncbi:MAG TPA: hypothetical protein VNJ46_06540 [Gaiellaceae bacterium]|nr:hypothetical protein [Gaiellaceae bacterium]
MGELRQATTTLEAAGRLAATAGEPGLAQRVRLRLSYLAVFAEGSSMLEHLAAAEEAAQVFEALGDDAGLAFALLQQAHMRRDTGQAELGLALAGRGARLAAAAGDLAGARACRRMAAMCAAVGPTRVPAALEVCDAADAIADTGGSSVWDARAWLLAQAGRIGEARALYEEAVARLRERGALLQLRVGMALAALAERAAGDLPRAWDLFRGAYALVDADVRGDVSAAAGELACVLALAGAEVEAARLAEEARAFLVPGDVLGGIHWRRATALVAARQGRREDALRLSNEACALADATDWLTFRAETHEEAALVRRHAGDAGAEAEALDAALALYERKGNRAGAERVRATLAGSDPWVGPGLRHVAQQSK